jgi:hypothetical protein
MRTKQLYRLHLFREAAMLLLLGAGTLFIAGCGGLSELARIVQPPRFEQDERSPELQLVAPSLSQPTGGAGVTIWMRITNPNPFGFTLSTLDVTLSLDGNRAARGVFPLGLPLTAGETSVVPVDLSISFADLPGLAGVIRQAAVGQAIPYQLDGTVGIDAGRFGQPTFGPLRLVNGEMRVGR